MTSLFNFDRLIQQQWNWAVWREIASNSAVILSVARENQFPKVLLLLLFVSLLCQKKSWPFKKLWNCTTSNLLFLFSKIVVTQKTNSWKFYRCFLLFVSLSKKTWNCRESNICFQKKSSNCRDTEKVVHDSFTKLFCVARKTNSKRSVASFVCVKKAGSFKQNLWNWSTSHWN